ncbi:MAG: hypothetical protein V1885_02330 [Candidatus Brennerbacteria bacterium]
MRKEDAVPLYRIPLLQRAIQLDNSFRKKEKCMALDGVGFFIRYSSDEELTPGNIRCYLVGIEHTHCIVEADSRIDAILKFLLEWEGAMIGGNSPESKALRVDPREPIMEMPPCALLHRNVADRFICGEERKDGNGEFGMCMLEQYDPPDFHCPIDAFFARRAHATA